MKRIFALIFCIALMCAMSVTIFAEGEVSESLPIEETVPTTETLAPEVTEPAPTLTEHTLLTSEEIVAWVKSHFEEISVVVTLLLNMIYMAKKHKLLNKSISDTNHNAITVSENSDRALAKALALMENYKNSSEAMIQKYKEASEEEKSKLYEALATATNSLETSKLANMELANEVAELLVLANIPNSKKEELYARHMAAVKNISEVKGIITPGTEVINDGNGETK